MLFRSTAGVVIPWGLMPYYSMKELHPVIDVIRLLYSFDNAYCDTAKAPPAIIQAAVQGIGAERVLFGSDWNRPEMKEYGPYFFRATYQHWYNLNTIALADMSEDQRDWVLYKSAHKLLKLDQA